MKSNNEVVIKRRMRLQILNLLLVSLVFVFSILISIGYSAINASLMVSGDLDYEARTLYRIIASSSKGLDTNMDFKVIPTETTSGVYEIDSTRNDTNPVYYYRGIVSNNNVSFAGFCWKIVRTTSTGGVKLIYNGVPASNGSCNNTGEASVIGASLFNEFQDSEHYVYDNIKYVGYTYDTNTDSTIKKYIDDWYSKNMINYTKMLEDTEWCQDRSIYDYKYEITLYYSAYERNHISYKPSIICPNVSDKYTVSSSKGNGLLKYPVALLTADEVTLAGINDFDIAENNYLNIGNNWWTLSPHNALTGNFYNIFWFFISSNSFLNIESGGFFDIYVRPAVSLAPKTIISEGDGTFSNPYKILTN